MSLYQMLTYFFIYGFLGWVSEVAFAGVKQRKFVNRGFLKGPICPIYGVSVTLVVMLLERFRSNILLLFILSFVLVTLLEGVTGFVLEKVFHNKWWDYSKRKFNIGGYVCLLFSVIWGFCCVIVVEFIQRFFEIGVAHLPIILGIIILSLLSIVLCIDVIVTSTKITKMNKTLMYMENIANELHAISNSIGEGVYKVVDLLDGDDDSDETKAKKAELHNKYKAAMENHSHDAKRIIKAFPNMNSKHYNTALSDTKKHINQTKHLEDNYG